jgi:membrane fusion protein, multidrug efflux system
MPIMKKKRIYIVSLLILAMTIWGVMKYHSRSAAQNPDAIWVKASVVKETPLPLEANTIGTLVARSVEITPEVAGHVEKILFRDGTFVEQGTPLIQLDNAVYKAKYESAKAKLAYSENDYKRKALLGKQGAIAQQAIDQAETDLKEKKAEARENEVMLNKMKLMAPFDGTVGKSKINPGDYVNIGQNLVTLTDTKHLRIEYNVPEKYLPSLKLRQEVKITSSTYSEKVFSGKVSFISPTINTDNRSVSLYADVPNENNLLAAGMYVKVIHSLGTEERALMIPARSLVPMLDAEQVYKIVDGKAYAVTIVIGKRTGDTVQVTQGLSSGDVVITDGQLKVKNGVPVKVKS